MIVLTIAFHCSVCNSKEFYVMPCDEMVNQTEKVQSLTKFLLRCKECGQKYLLDYNIKVIN